MRAGVETMRMGWKRGIACANETTCLASEQPVTVLAEQRVECYGSSFVLTLLPRLGYQNEMECPHPLAHFLLSNSALICDFYSTSARHIIICHRTFDAAVPRCTSANFTHWRKENYTNSIRFFNFFTLHGSVVDASLYSINFIPTTSWTNAHSFIVFHNNSIGIKCLSIFWRKCSTKLTIIGKYFEYLQFSGFYLLCFKMNGRIKCLRIQK